MRPLIAGNWKMNGMARQLGEIETIAALVKAAPPFADVLICQPAPLIARAVQTAAGLYLDYSKNRIDDETIPPAARSGGALRPARAHRCDVPRRRRQALKLDTVNKRFVLNVDKERLESAPGFDKDDWPNMADPALAEGIHAYYGTKLYMEARAFRFSPGLIGQVMGTESIGQYNCGS